MSQTLPYEYQSDFPDMIDTFGRMSDIEAGDLALLQEYYRLFNAGNLTAAKQLLINNPQLDAKFMNADKWNRLRDAIIAVQKHFMAYGFSGSGNRTRGIWNPAVNYLMGDNVSWDNIIWQAVEGSIGSEPSDSNTDWIKVLTPESSSAKLMPLTWGNIRNGTGG